MLTRRHLLPALLGVLSVLTVGCAPTGIGPTQTVTFSAIVAADPADYGNYLFKLTYMGPQSRILKTMVFGSATPRSVTRFLPYRRPGHPYVNDDRSDIVDFGMSAAEVGAIVGAMSSDAVFTDNSDRPTPVLSLMIMRDVGGPDEKVFETLVEFADANRLVRGIIGRNLDLGNTDGAKYIRYWSKNVGG